MNQIDYEAEYATLHAEISKTMRRLGLRPGPHEYHYKVFGSWWIKFSKSGTTHRLIFDGRDYRLTIEDSAGDELAFVGNTRYRNLLPLAEELLKSFT